MTAVKAAIVEWVDDSYPGFVRCALVDAWGRTWSFVDKLPAFTLGDLDRQNPYPQPGSIACEVIRRWRDPAGREIVTVTTERPWGIEATTGETVFDVLVEELEGQ